MKEAKSISYSILRTAILVAVVGMCFPENTFGQKLSDTISIREVQVLGKRKLEEAGLVVTRIDTLALQMMKTQTVSELLTSYSPVFIKSHGRGSVATACFAERRLRTRRFTGTASGLIRRCRETSISRWYRFILSMM